MAKETEIIETVTGSSLSNYIVQGEHEIARPEHDEVIAKALVDAVKQSYGDDFDFFKCVVTKASVGVFVVELHHMRDDAFFGFTPMIDKFTSVIRPQED